MRRPQIKQCNMCNIVKNIDNFYNNHIRPDGSIKYRPECKKCTSEKRKRKYDPQKQREKSIRLLYGLEYSEYNNLLKLQGNVCKICGSGPKYKKYLCVDHCHNTGVVRGLLCGNCNTALGKFQDNPELLKRAITYLGNK